MRKLLLGDCLARLPELPASVADSLVTDPPAGISFMGKEWDANKGGRNEWVAWLAQVMAESMRVLKPGAHGLVWALPRTSHWTATALEDAGFEIRDVVTHLFGTGFPKNKSVLKPASEHWILIRKPLAERSIAANVDKYGTGTLSVDACRIPVDPDDPVNKAVWTSRASAFREGTTGFITSQRDGDQRSTKPPEGGRWPANLIISEPADNLLGESARFFYVAKASKSERNAGLGDGKNTHPTVKALALMRYLCRLITPPGGTVLDPFMGSGSTGVAALQEGFDFIGIEREQEYFDIAKARVLACRDALQGAIKESA